LLDEALAIEQARQLVVLGHVEDAALCLLLPGDVLENRHEMLHLADRLPDRARRLLRVDLVGPRAVQHGLAPPRLTGARTLPQHRAEPEAGGVVSTMADVSTRSPACNPVNPEKAGLVQSSTPSTSEMQIALAAVSSAVAWRCTRSSSRRDSVMSRCRTTAPGLCIWRAGVT
jgi:hypothetical protein